MKKAKKKKGLHPAVAVGFFAVAAGVAGKAFLGLTAGPATGGPLSTAVAPVAEPTSALPDGQATEAIAWKDLLAAHGSYDRKTQVRVAFSTLAELKNAFPAPFGETGPVEQGRWTGEDPPTIHVGVVMVSAGSRRAVIDGRVVGIGETIKNTSVAEIERDVVILKMGDRRLTYDFDNEYPREFRSEQLLREQERAQKAAEEAAAAARTDATRSVDGKAPDVKDAGGTVDKLLEQAAAKKPPEEAK